jgi:Flp pilus assembly protein TadD
MARGTAGGHRWLTVSETASIFGIRIEVGEVTITPLRVMVALAGLAAVFVLVVALTTRSGLRVDPGAEVFSGSGGESSRVLRRAFAYARQGLGEEAEIAFRRAKELDPRQPLPYARLAEAYAERGEFQRALDELDQAEAAGIEHVELAVARSSVLRGMGLEREAEEALVEACERYPGEAGPFRSLGWFLLRDGKAAEAIPRLEDAVSLQPDVAYNHVMLARAYAADGRVEDAARATEAAARLDPDQTDALMLMGWTCAKEGRHEEAVQHFSEAVARQPGNAEPRMALAQSLEKLGRSEEALEQWEQAARSCPEDPSAHRALGRAYERRGMCREAARSYRWVLELGDPDPEIAERLVSVLLACGDSTEARSAAREVAILLPEDEELAALAARLSVGP